MKMNRILSVVLTAFVCGSIVYLFSSVTPTLAQEDPCPVRNPTPTPTPTPEPTPTPTPTPEPTPDPCDELHEELIEEGQVYWTCNYGNCGSTGCTEWISWSQTNYYQEFCSDGTPWGDPYAKTRSGEYEGTCDECSCCENVTFSSQSSTSSVEEPSDVIHSVNYSDSVTYATLEELAKDSRLIVVGAPADHRQYLTKDGRSVTSDHSVTIQEVLKGDVPPERMITVSVPGGWHRFADGKKLVVRTPDQRLVVEGQSYVFFLRGPSGTARGYAPTGGGQGLFDLRTRARIARFSSSEQSGAGTVRPTTRTPPLAAKYTGMPVNRFLAEVREAIEKDRRASR